MMEMLLYEKNNQNLKRRKEKMKPSTVKRSLTSLLGLMVIISVIASGCTPKPAATATTAPAQPPAPAKTYTIGLSNFSLGNSWRVQMVAEAQYAAKNNPMVKDLIVTEADNSVEKQIADIEDLITKKVDAILITAIIYPYAF
jgi:ABC-type sugar transport system substrate-binding protein